MTNKTLQDRNDQIDLFLDESSKARPRGEEEGSGYSDLPLLEKFYPENILSELGMKDPDIFTIIFLYVVLLIPVYFVVRFLLFMILPKSWLKWLFRF